MKVKRQARCQLFLTTCVTFACLGGTTALADQFGLFTYWVVGETIEIADYPTDAVGEVVIPDEIDGKPVTRIGAYAFEECAEVTTVTMPSSVDFIGEGAFSYCEGLTSIVIPPNVISIGAKAFYYCRGLTSIIIPPKVTSIGESAFYYCRELTNISIPVSVATIGVEAFYECKALTSVTVEPSNPNYASVEGVLFDAGQTTLVYYPAERVGGYTIPDGVTTIGTSAFRRCSGLTGVTIPSSVTTIGESALRQCTGLTSVTIPSSVTSIGDFAFRQCLGLSHVTIPSGVVTVGNGAFRSCTLLTSVTFGSSVVGVGQHALLDCGQLSTAVFLGDAPGLGFQAFWRVAPGFAIYYLSSRGGFTSPTWRGYPTVEIDEAAFPAASWLVTHGLAHDTDLDQDLNGDGVSLLMAYALNLDPRLDLSGSMPPAVARAGNGISITFYGAAAGITYTGWTSTGLLGCNRLSANQFQAIRS